MKDAEQVLATMPPNFSTQFFVAALNRAGVNRPKSIRVFLGDNGCRQRHTGWKSPDSISSRPETPVVTNQEL